ncbi:MAG: carotenoid oxygenase family protein [Pseudomonadota bacterium]
MASQPALDLNSYNPYLHGPYRPVERELDISELPVTGELPTDFAGAYFRNGPNPLTMPSGMHHWFDGDGMVHGVYLEDGQARYVNRYVVSADFEADRTGHLEKGGIMYPATSDGTPTTYKDTANTDILVHNGELMALWYVSGQPVRLNARTLDTIRTETFAGKLPKNVSAHSKVDPATGEFLFFDYQLFEPRYSFGVVSSDNRLTHFTDIELPGPRLPHDMAITENYAVLMDLPVVLTDKALKAKRWNIHFDPKLNTRFGVLPRNGSGSKIRWFEFDSCYIYHVINAWEEGDEVVMTACRFLDNGRPLDNRFGPYAGMVDVLALRAHVYMWRMNMKTGETREIQLDDTVSEFPVINLGHTGKASRYSYLATIPDTSTQIFDGVMKFDFETKTSETYRFPLNCYGSEPAFAPRKNAGTEDDGYVVSIVTNTVDDTSALLVLDAKDMAAGPVAQVHLPQRVPLGFHGTWANSHEMAVS